MVYRKGRRRRSFLVLWSESDSGRGPGFFFSVLVVSAISDIPYLPCRLSTCCCCCCCSVSDYLIYIYIYTVRIGSDIRMIVSPLRKYWFRFAYTVGWSLQLLFRDFLPKSQVQLALPLHQLVEINQKLLNFLSFISDVDYICCYALLSNLGIIERHYFCHSIQFCRWWRRPAASILSSLVWSSRSSRSSRSHCHITPFVAACLCINTLVGAGSYYWRRRASFLFLFFDCYIAPMLSRQFSYIKCRLGDARSTTQ